jgi:hypothetical protein
MNDSNPRPLDYAVARKEANHGRFPGDFIVGSAALLLIMIQFLSFLPLTWWLLGALEDGSAKRPFHDLCYYLMTTLPSVAAIIVGLWHCWREFRQPASLRNCKRSIFAMIVSALFIAFIVYEWFDEDIIHRNISHGFW